MQNLPVFGMDGARDQNVTATGQPLGHQHGFGERGGTVVHGSVGNFLAGDLAHQSLKLEYRGERALREFGLVRRVGSEKFAALDQRIGRDGPQMLVHAGTEKRNVAARIFRGACLKILNDLGFRKRAGQIKRGAQPESFRNRCEEFFDETRPDRGQHFLAFGGAFGEIAHQAECSLACAAM